MKNIDIKLNQVFPVLTIASLLQFCTPAISTSTSVAGYEEDLSVYREEYPAPIFDQKDGEKTSPSSTQAVYIRPTHDIKIELDTVINRIIESRKNITTVDGYSIQLYAGSNRDKAYQIKAKTYELSEDLKPKIIYDQPNYKVRVGKYHSRLEANADFVLLQKHFSRVVLIPNKIRI